MINSSYRIKCIVISMVFLCTCYSLEAQEKWELAKEKDNITVYTKDTEGSRIKSYKTVAILDCAVDDLIPVYMDAERFTEWVFHCPESREIARENDTLVYYSIYSMPFPFKDRDLVARRVKRTNPDGSVSFDVNQIEGVLDNNDDYVRIPAYEERSTLIPLDNEKVKVVSEGFFDPGGSLPSWLLNMFIADGPVETFINLRELVAEDRKK